MDTERPLRISPSPNVEGLEAYAVPAPSELIDLPLGGTERPVWSDELHALAQRFANVVTADSLCRYPYPGEIEAALAVRIGVAAERVLVTAGADEALDRACRAVLGPGRSIVAAEPTFEMIPHYARLAGAQYRCVPWTSGSYPCDAILAATDETTSAVVVVSPNNPTGGTATPSDLRRIAETLPHALVIVDLAYVDYADTDLTHTVAELPNAIATRTLSKAWGTPGLRVGYAVGHPRVIGWMRAAGGPYSVSKPSLAIAMDRLSNGDEDVAAYVSRVREERDRLGGLIAELGGSSQPSQANFVLARLPRADWVRAALAGLGVGVRAFPAQPALAGCVRISCPGAEPAFERLEHALRTAVRPQALLFDLDGVLADVSGSYRQAIIETARAFGVDVTPADIAAAKAAGNANNDWVLTHRLITPHGVSATLDEVTEQFEAIYQGTEQQPGLRETEQLLPRVDLMRTLAERLPLAVVTGRPRADAEHFLGRAGDGLRGCFETLVCMEDAPAKPDPEPVRLCLQRLNVRRAWMVGDTPDDVRAARGAAVVPLGVVAPGDAPESVRESLQGAGAARVLDDLTQLLELVP